MDLSKKELAQKVSILYYEKNKSQNEIAKEIEISRSYVSQLLSFARENGIVKIEVNVDEYELRMIRKEVEFKALFPKLKHVYIMASESDDFTNMNLGKFASVYIAELMNDANIIGINLGRSVEDTINYLDGYNFSNQEEKKIVQIMGGFNNSKNFNSAHPNELVNKLSSIVGCEGHYLNCPVIIENPELRNSMLMEKSIDEVISLWDKLDLTIMGIGVANDKSKLFKLLSSEMMDTVVKSGAYADLTTNFLDKNGNYLPILEENKVGIPFDSLKKVDRKAVICSGEYKKNALLAALKGGLIDVLITDSITVDAVLELL